jgi:hypothetical protein
MVALAGCLPDLPRELWLDDRMTSDEEAVVEQAIDAANGVLGDGLLGHPVIELRGRVTDPDGFQFSDFGDDLHVVYMIEPDSPEVAWLNGATGVQVDGYGTLGDVLLVRDHGDLADPRAARGFRILVEHELGHFLGMSHDPDPDSVMYPGPTPASVTTYTDADRRAFCIDYACAHAP